MFCMALFIFILYFGFVLFLFLNSIVLFIVFSEHATTNVGLLPVLMMGSVFP